MWVLNTTISLLFFILSKFIINAQSKKTVVNYNEYEREKWMQNKIQNLLIMETLNKKNVHTIENSDLKLCQVLLYKTKVFTVKLVLNNQS